MSQKLVKIEPAALQAGGQGFNYQSKWAAPEPATLSIVQQMSDAVNKGVPPGKLYIKETEQAFTEMQVVLLAMPKEQRDYYVGQQRTNETRMCFSYDLEKPDDRAQDPQAMLCAACPHNIQSNEAWEPWRNSTLPNEQKRNLIPKCDTTYYAVFIDTQYRLPLQMWIRGRNSKDAFDSGMKNLTRTLYMMKSQGLNPNIFDVRFTLSSVPGGQKNHVLKMTNFKAVTPEEREAFGEVYMNYVNSRVQSATKRLEAAAQADAETAVTEALTPGGNSEPIDGEYITV